MEDKMSRIRERSFSSRNLKEGSGLLDFGSIFCIEEDGIIDIWF